MRTNFWTEMTIIKHPKEIELLRQSLKIVDIGIKRGMEVVKPGVTELEVATEAEYAMKKAGSEFSPTIGQVASGLNAGIYERIATEKKIVLGESVIIDLTCSYKGYTGDSGRTVFAGGKVSAEQKKKYQVLYKSLHEAIAAVKTRR